MATVKRLFMEGVADNVVFDSTPTEVAGTGDTAPTTAANSPTIHVASDGRREMEISTTASAQTARWTDLNLANWSLAFELRLKAAVAAITTFTQLGHSGGLLSRMTLGTDSRVTLQDTAGAYETISSAALTVQGAATDDALFRNRFCLWGSAATDAFNIRIYNAAGTLILDELNRPIGAFDNLISWIWGKTGATGGGPFYLSQLQVDDVAAEIPAPTTADATLSASKTTNVEPGETVTLTLGGGTTTAITQTAGPTVTLSGTGNTRTFTAPYTLAGTTLTFSHTVQGDATPASVSIAVLRTTLKQRNAANTLWLPAARRSF